MVVSVMLFIKRCLVRFTDLSLLAYTTCSFSLIILSSLDSGSSTLFLFFFHYHLVFSVIRCLPILQSFVMTPYGFKFLLVRWITMKFFCAHNFIASMDFRIKLPRLCILGSQSSDHRWKLDLHSLQFPGCQN